MDQLAKVESIMMSISFPGDSRQLPGTEGILLEGHPTQRAGQVYLVKKDRFSMAQMRRYRCVMDEGSNWAYPEDHVRRTSPIFSASP